MQCNVLFLPRYFDIPAKKCNVVPKLFKLLEVRVGGIHDDTLKSDFAAVMSA